MYQIYFGIRAGISHLLTDEKQHFTKKSPLSGIAVYVKKPFFYITNLKSCNHENLHRLYPPLF